METQTDYHSRAQFILNKAVDHHPDLDTKIHTFYSDISKVIFCPTQKQQP